MTEWADPPTRKPRVESNPIMVQAAADCQAHPGRWAVLRDQPASLGWRINHGRVKPFRPEGSFEAVTRDNKPDGKCDVYVRFVGDQP